MRQRATASTIGMALLFTAACGASPTSSVSSTGSPASGASSNVGVPPATAGKTMVTTTSGYQFWVSVTKPVTKSSDLKVLPSPDPLLCGKYDWLTCWQLPDAPPGTDYIYAVLTVTNKTDRAEPLDMLWGGPLLLVPVGEWTQFGACSSGCVGAEVVCEGNGTRDPNATPDPSMYCVEDFTSSGSFSTNDAQSLCHPTDPYNPPAHCDLGPGQSGNLYLFWPFPISASAPIGDVRVYFLGGNGNQLTLTRIG